MSLKKNAAFVLSAGLMLGAAAAVQPAHADSINVLWYAGGVTAGGGTTPTANYQTNISNLATPTAGDPSTATWNITYWNSGAMPAGTYNAMVVASPQGGWGTYPNYAALNTAVGGGLAFGNRLMATGQDADWHYQNFPGPTNFNGPQGFLRDAVNWAGNGKGMGLVDLGAADLSGLASVLKGIGSDTGLATNNVQIPSKYASFPINSSLTSSGLSNWSTSAHDSWASADPSIWTGINIDGNNPGDFVTLVTEGGGGSIAGTPLPAALPLFATGLGAMGLLGWRRKRKNAALAAA
jgi:hypothetical protein